MKFNIGDIAYIYDDKFRDWNFEIVEIISIDDKKFNNFYQIKWCVFGELDWIPKDILRNIPNKPKYL